MGAGQAGEAEVAADGRDDLGDGQVVDVVVEVERVQALVDLGVESVCLSTVGVALDGVLDLADDLLARDAAALGGLRGRAGRGGRAERASESDGAADGTGDAVEGDGEVGCCDWGCDWGWGGLAGLLGGGSGRCVCLWGSLAVEGAGEVGADLDQLVEDLAVVLGVLVTLAQLGGAGVVGWFGTGGRGGYRGG